MMLDLTQWQLPLTYLIASIAFGYVLGSIPFGLIFSRMAGLGDIRTIGSGNIGATNVLRTGNKKIAAATLLVDGLKGTLAVLIAREFGQEQALLAGFGAFLGHLFPVWLKFKGGKGVATYIGIILGLAPIGIAVFALIWLSTALIFRYSSLAAILALIATPIGLYHLTQIEFAELTGVMSIIAILKHHENIKRLFSGTESKIGSKKK